MRFTVALLLALALTVVTAAVALAGWQWNSQLDIEGVDTRVRWTVTDGSDPNAYGAVVRVAVPVGADATLVARMTDAEQVVIVEDQNLSCRADGVEVRATVRVLPHGAVDGSQAQAWLVANGVVLDSDSGKLTKRLEVAGVLPVRHPSC